MTSEQINKILALAKSRCPKGKNFHVERTKKFLDGDATYIFYLDEDGEEAWDVFYCEGESIEPLDMAEQVIEMVNERVNRPLAERLISSVMNVGGISGLLALIMTLAVVVLAYQQAPIPQLLEQALLLAFGFYFGNVRKNA